MMCNRILLVEDDEDFGMILKQYLELSGFEVVWVPQPTLVANYFANWQFDIGILDVMMPDLDGFSLAKNILERFPDFPFLFLTAKNQKIDRLTGLKIGAEDYLAKPCEPEELVLRLKNILKRTQRLPMSSVRIGRYELCRESHQLKSANQVQRLTQKELEILMFLLRHNHTLVTKESILAQFWDEVDYFSARSLDVFISRLRKYFHEEPAVEIRSVRGVGYQVDFPLDEVG